MARVLATEPEGLAPTRPVQLEIAEGMSRSAATNTSQSWSQSRKKGTRRCRYVRAISGRVSFWRDVLNRNADRRSVRSASPSRVVARVGGALAALLTDTYGVPDAGSRKQHERKESARRGCGGPRVGRDGADRHRGRYELARGPPAAPATTPASAAHRRAHAGEPLL